MVTPLFTPLLTQNHMLFVTMCGGDVNQIYYGDHGKSIYTNIESFTHLVIICYMSIIAQ